MPSKKFDPLITINMQNALNMMEKKLFFIKKSIKNILVDIMLSLEKIKNKTTITVWIIIFFNGLVIKFKSEKMPRVKSKI